MRLFLLLGYDQGSSGSRPISPGQQSGSIAGRHGTVKKNINRLTFSMHRQTDTNNMFMIFTSTSK